jgi:hypothetical protein
MDQGNIKYWIWTEEGRGLAEQNLLAIYTFIYLDTLKEPR